MAWMTSWIFIFRVSALRFEGSSWFGLMQLGYPRCVAREENEGQALHITWKDLFLVN